MKINEMNIKKYINFFDIFHQKRIFNYIYNLGITDIIDVGSHEGEFLKSILKLKKLNNIYCFEPQVEKYNQLIQKYQKNNRIYFFNLALGDRKKQKFIFINKLTSTSTLQKFNKKSTYLKIKKFLINTKKFYEKKYLVKVETIDEVFKKKKLKNCLLKIDTEGYELNILKGSKNKIKKEIKFILLEKQFFKQYENNNFQDIEKLLKKNKFKLLKNFTFPTIHFQDRLYIKI